MLAWTRRIDILAIFAEAQRLGSRNRVPVGLRVDAYTGRRFVFSPAPLRHAPLVAGPGERICMSSVRSLHVAPDDVFDGYRSCRSCRAAQVAQRKERG